MSPVVNDVGYSTETPEKIRIFGETLKSLMADTHDRYDYVDITAGPGRTPEIGDGSPIIACKMYLALGVHGHLLLFEKTRQNVDDLRTLCGVSPYSTLNIRIVWADAKRALGRELKYLTARNRGVLYSDTTGLPPFALLRQFSRWGNCAGLDVLIHVSAWATKIGRARRRETHHIRDEIDRMDRKYWWLTEPRGRGQWLFLLGSNKDHNLSDEWIPRNSYRGTMIECRVSHSCSVRRNG